MCVMDHFYDYFILECAAEAKIITPYFFSANALINTEKRLICREFVFLAKIRASEAGLGSTFFAEIVIDRPLPLFGAVELYGRCTISLSPL